MRRSERNSNGTFPKRNNKAAVTAVLLVHGKSRAELETLRSELATPELRKTFAESLLVSLLPHLPSMSIETGAEYCEDIVMRMHFNVNMRLSSEQELMGSKFRNGVRRA